MIGGNPLQGYSDRSPALTPSRQDNRLYCPLTDDALTIARFQEDLPTCVPCLQTLHPDSMAQSDRLCECRNMNLTHLYRLLASGAADATVSVFDLQTLTCLRTFAGVDQPVRYVSFSHDGRYLAYVEGGASVDPGVYIEEVATGTAFLKLPCTIGR